MIEEILKNLFKIVPLIWISIEFKVHIDPYILYTLVLQSYSFSDNSSGDMHNCARQIVEVSSFLSCF